MPVHPDHDFGTVRLFVTGDVVEVLFPRGDDVTKGVVRGLKGFWDGNRRAWRVTTRNARTDADGIATAVRNGLRAAAPEKWRLAMPKLATIATTTRNYALKLGEGGMRLELPQGHRHEYTLAHDVSGAFRDGPVWLLPASICANATVRGVILDVVEDDRQALAEAIDYLGDFVFSGRLDLVPDEIAQIGLAPGATVFADPSFVRTADANIGPEPLHEYPMLCHGIEPAEEGYQARLQVMAGREGWLALRARYAGSPNGRSRAVDGTHVAGRWSRRRA